MNKKAQLLFLEIPVRDEVGLNLRIYFRLLLYSLTAPGFTITNRAGETGGTGSSGPEKS